LTNGSAETGSQTQNGLSQIAPDIALMVRAEAEGSAALRAAETPGLTIAGRRWVVLQQSEDSPVPEYCCVSYSWATSRAPHPLAPDTLVSARAMPVLETALSACDASAIWLDAICVPFDEPSRTATLRSMGRSMAAAPALSSYCRPSVRVPSSTSRSGEVGEADLRDLEVDDWVTRAWTYQECANGAEARFCAEGSTGQSVSGSELLDAVGKALSDYGKSHGMDAFAVRQQFPGLDTLAGC
jgi:hypothetical protein